MSEQQDELKTSYQKLKERNEELSSKLNSMTERVDRLVASLETERNERLEVERSSVMEKINAFKPDFEGKDLTISDLKILLRGMQLVGKQNASASSGLTELNLKTEPTIKKANAYLNIDIDPKLDAAPAVILGSKDTHEVISE